ncbi:MAG TPA: carboxymuconolactone decarboxylase family protein [Solirubrobacteraceae bacterium]|nr:carboxymuconolactone decarboxylase family protein [Solirubrobacteraceae bacterium]
MASNPRIPKAEISGILGAAAKHFSKRQLGFVPDPLAVMWHNRRVLRTLLGMSRKVESWDACDPQLKSLAHMATVSLVGCSFCLDFGYYQAHNAKLDLAKAREVPRWRESTVFTPLEREVMEYAEAMTHTTSAVTDAMSARLLDQLGAPALVELTAMIALANMAARMNTALGIEAQGISSACGLRPLASPEVRSPVPA